MREILFRGKRKDTGEWIYSESIIRTDLGSSVFMPIVSEPCICKHDVLTGNIVGIETCKLCNIIPITVGQYTGLTDKNGKKIFEGDIVDILTENEEIGVVAYDDGGFLVNADGFCVDFINNINGTDVRVIGNIHDNPELLEVGE